MTFSYHAFGTLTSTQSPASGFNPIVLTGASALLLTQSTEDFAVTSGVPQGSFLGPLLFSTFINQLPAHLHGVNTVLFVDDTTVFLAGSSIADISATLSSANWFLSSGLRLNVAKIKYMFLHSSRRIPTSALEVQLNSRTIDRVQRYKFLGVI